jgi:predicted Zn-dependent protease
MRSAAEKSALPVSDDDLRLVGEIGLFAARHGPLLHAQRLFEALHIVKPDRTLPWIGLAQVLIGCGRHDEAAKLLKTRALAQHPADGELLVFLALALFLGGHGPECEATLRQAARHGHPDDPHVAMASTLYRARTGQPLPSPENSNRAPALAGAER